MATSAWLRVGAAVGLADILIVVGGVCAVTGFVWLFGWAVTLAAFGFIALLCGIALVARETRGRYR